MKKIAALIIYLCGIVALYYRHYLLPIIGYNQRIDMVFTILIMYFCIRGIIRTIKDLVDAIDNRKMASLSRMQGFVVEIDGIINLVLTNDIVEIKAYKNGEVFSFGSSACSEPNNQKLYNKMYYIKDEKYNSFIVFRNRLYSLFPDHLVKVWKVDELSCEQYKSLVLVEKWDSKND